MTWVTSPSSCRARPAYAPATTSTRPWPHELADCLWSVLTLADAYDVDLAGAFTATMDELDEVLAAD